MTPGVFLFWNNVVGIMILLAFTTWLIYTIPVQNSRARKIGLIACLALLLTRLTAMTVSLLIIGTNPLG